LSANNKCHTELEPQYNARDYSFLNNHDIKLKVIKTIPDALGDTRHIADLYLMNENLWSGGITGAIKDAYDSHRKLIRDNTPLSPLAYRTIDFFSTREAKPVFDNSRNDVVEIKPVLVDKPVDTYLLFADDLDYYSYPSG
jgi:hypothetical protein